MWIKYHSLSTDVRGQLEGETGAIGRESAHSLDRYLRAKIDKSEPLHQPVSRAVDSVGSHAGVKYLLVEIRGEGERNEKESDGLSSAPRSTE